MLVSVADSGAIYPFNGLGQKAIIVPLHKDNGRTKWKECGSLITDMLAHGQMKAVAVHEACLVAGFKPAIIRKAKKKLCITSVFTGSPQTRGHWNWSL